MDFEFSDSQKEIRAAVAALCARFGNEYWRQCDEKNAYPDEFVRTMSEAGWLSALIPQQYGGAGLGMLEASLILEEINRSGGNAVACHAQMYTMASILKHGSAEQKQRYLPRIASGELRLQSFGITEPDAGSETPRIKTFARRQGDQYVVSRASAGECYCRQETDFKKCQNGTITWEQNLDANMSRCARPRSKPVWLAWMKC